jgi:hypothetical protein
VKDDGIISLYTQVRLIFLNHMIGKFCAVIQTLWELQKIFEDCKTDGADRPPRFATSCSTIFVTPQRVWERDDIVRDAVQGQGVALWSCKGDKLTPLDCHYLIDRKTDYNLMQIQAKLT